MASSSENLDGFFYFGKETALKPVDSNAALDLEDSSNFVPQSSYLLGSSDPSFFEIIWGSKSLDTDEMHLSFSQKDRKTGEVYGFCCIRNWNRLARNAEIYEYDLRINSSKNVNIERYAMMISICFDRLDLNRITIFQIDNNEMLEFVCNKLELKNEGIMRKLFFHKGKYHDAKIWSMLKSEYNDKLENIKNYLDMPKG